MYDIFMDNSDCRLCDSYNCFYGFYTGLLFYMEGNAMTD